MNPGTPKRPRFQFRRRAAAIRRRRHRRFSLTYDLFSVVVVAAIVIPFLYIPLKLILFGTTG
jgi:hypothetical protein